MNTRSIPGVEIGDVLGAGTFGTVYPGRHKFLDIDVAVKLIDPSPVGGSSPSQILQEAQLMARLDHPNLLRVFDAGVLERHIYLVCEFMNGGSCANLHDVTPAGATHLSMQLLLGLQALHGARILHRDIKPANCLKRTDDRVKLADLGLAMEVTSSGDVARETAGTIPFMAPELFDNPPRYSTTQRREGDGVGGGGARGHARRCVRRAGSGLGALGRPRVCRDGAVGPFAPTARARAGSTRGSPGLAFRARSRAGTRDDSRAWARLSESRSGRRGHFRGRALGIFELADLLRAGG